METHWRACGGCVLRFICCEYFPQVIQSGFRFAFGAPVGSGRELLPRTEQGCVYIHTYI